MPKSGVEQTLPLSPFFDWSIMGSANTTSTVDRRPHRWRFDVNVVVHIKAWTTTIWLFGSVFLDRQRPGYQARIGGKSRIFGWKKSKNYNFWNHLNTQKRAISTKLRRGGPASRGVQTPPPDYLLKTERLPSNLSAWGLRNSRHDNIIIINIIINFWYQRKFHHFDRICAPHNSFLQKQKTIPDVKRGGIIKFAGPMYSRIVSAGIGNLGFETQDFGFLKRGVGAPLQENRGDSTTVLTLAEVCHHHPTMGVIQHRRGSQRCTWWYQNSLVYPNHTFF